MRPGRKRGQQSGYALLMVLLMAAIIAISLYREIPRVAFESQRQKEELLIERGEQYKRAIQLFVKANQRWPGKIEDLEDTNNIRYLRKRFADPMTGKDEWRVIHIQNGVLQDSVNTKKDQPKEVTQRTDSYVGLQAGIGQTLSQPGAQASNIAMRRRPSDNLPQGPGDLAPDASGQPPQTQPGQPGQTVQNGQPVQPGQPGQPAINVTSPPPGALPPGIPGVIMNNGQPPQPGQVQIANQILAGRRQGDFSGITAPPAPKQPNSQTGSSYIGGGSAYIGGGSYIGSTPAPGNTQGLPPQPGGPVNSQTGGVSPAPYPTTLGANGNPPNFGQPGLQTGQQPVNAVPNPAAQMINNLLTQPRPGGAPASTAPGGLIGAGIAGFASNLDADSIKVYNDHQNYAQWEFLFDPAKQKPVMNPVTGQITNGVGAMGNMPANRNGAQNTVNPVPTGGTAK